MRDGQVDLVAQGFDAIYETVAESPTLARIWRDHATGRDFPQAFSHVSYLTLAELTSMADELALGAGEMLIDLACGTGGPGLWVAKRTGTRLIGVDISKVGLRRAGERAAALGLSDRSRFREGTFAAPGLASASAAGAMSVEALQYSPDMAAAFSGIARALAPGGRLVFTAFELDLSKVSGLPMWPDPVDDYRPVLEASGFTVARYEQTPGWSDRVVAASEAVLAERDALEAELGPAASTLVALEASSSIGLRPYSGRVFAVAIRD